ncbi:shikimate dehydrogenase family protein [Ruminococcus flavefaciens]|uniref:shikimate dehydrogenase family protein n=1 Tax=Ruminococcus flavefaciens TaxID=1265 RepID=UPI0026F29499|nr:shikimate dehydrogenase [Ruminococcus flavefaciens]MDD7517844.1 shikimate dehydrogenase [Ruminococcus flavefaciens]MDY5691831.1 shikimate dehydrogenase [Ruminococcus flavefaciens]
MNKFALIGHPLGHSMSPLIHEKLFALSGLDDTSYELIDIAPEKIAESRELLESLRGLNVTIPHKQNVIPLLDELAESALRYNSVNCISNNGGKLTGYNTDCDGFLRSAELLPISGNVAILGCGGVGRMIAIEVARHGGSITLAVIPQDFKNAQLLMAEILAKCSDACVKIVDISTLEGNFDLLINATPVGMYPKVDACAVSDTIIENSLSVFDVIYNPTETLLMKKARAMGKTAVGGASMLVYQAVKAHEIWYGGKFAAEDISKIIIDVENAVDSMNK